MWDDITGTVWSHLDGFALEGAHAGEQLEILPLQTTTWSAWVAGHPDTTVPVLDNGFSYRRGGSIGGAGLGGTFLDTLDRVDERLPDNELLIGVLAGDEAWAFPLDARSEGAPMQGEVGGVPVVILEDAEGNPSHAYHRLLSDDTALDFARNPASGAIHDLQTGSAWSSDGLAVEGDLAGVQLAFVTSFFTEWYGWAAFHPDTLIYGGAS